MSRTNMLAVVACVVLTGTTVALVVKLRESRAALAIAQARIDEMGVSIARERAARTPGELPAPVAATGASEPAAPDSQAPKTETTDATDAASAPADEDEPPMPSATRSRLMAARARENARAIYGDFAAEQGLPAEDAEALYEIIGAQYRREMSGIRDTSTPDSAADENARIAERLGGSIVQPLERYRESLPVRMEVAELASQLRSLGRPLNPAQKLEIGRAITRDQLEHGPPHFSPDQSPEDAVKAYDLWRVEQQRRIDQRVRELLTPEQMQMQDELRREPATSGP